MAKPYGKEKPKFVYTELTRELKQNGPERLYLLWGPEDYLLQDFIGRVRKLCVSEGSEDFDAKRLDGPQPDTGAVEEALNAMPFFGGRTFLELRGFDINKCRDEHLQELLGDVPDWCTVVITLPAGTEPDKRLSLYKQISKLGKAVEFTAQGQEDMYRWLTRRFEFHGKKIGRAEMDRLMFLSGELMNRLIPEIDKICAYSRDERITVQDIEAVAHHIPEAVAFDLTECLARSDYDGAARLLAELLAEDSEPIEIMGLIGWQMRQLYGARLAMDTGKGAVFIKDVLGIANDYRVRKLMDTAKGFSLKALTEDVRLCAELGMRTRESGAYLTDEEALKELLVRFAMEDRHA